MPSVEPGEAKLVDVSTRCANILSRPKLALATSDISSSDSPV